MISYFYCNSYQAFLAALFLAIKEEKVLIITAKPAIVKLAGSLGVECVLIRPFEWYTYVLKPYSVFQEIQRIKKIIGTNVFNFSHRQWDIFLFILLCRFTKKSKVQSQLIFWDFEFNYKHANTNLFSSKYLFSVLYLLALRIFYNTKLHLRFVSGNYVHSLKESFIQKHTIKKHITNVYRDIFLPASIYYKTDCIKVKHLFIDQTITGISTQRTLDLESILKEVHFKIKEHPLNKECTFNLEKYEVDYPLELVLNNVSGTIVSFYSAALITSALYGIKTISLINMIDRSDNQWLEFREKFILELNIWSEGKILFPKTMDEFKRLIMSLDDK